MDLIYLGSGAFGLPTLKALASRHTIRAVITQPDRPAGRGGHLTPTPIALWAAANLPDVPVLKPENVNDPAMIAQIHGISAGPLRGPSSVHPPISRPPGLFPLVVIAFGQKLSPALLTNRFAINLHGSLLPRWRGAAPINAAVLAGDTHAGNSIITLADRMDAGLILAQSRRDLPPHLTAGELHDLLASDGPGLIQDVLAAFETGALTPRPQDEALATRAPKLSRADGWINFAAGAEACRRRIHGLTPWPGIAVYPRSDRNIILKLTRVQIADTQTEEGPGILVDPEHGLIACGHRSTLQLLEVHPAGKRRMSWADFQHGHHLSAGEQLVSQISAPHDHA